MIGDPIICIGQYGCGVGRSLALQSETFGSEWARPQIIYVDDSNVTERINIGKSRRHYENSKSNIINISEKSSSWMEGYDKGALVTDSIRLCLENSDCPQSISLIYSSDCNLGGVASYLAEYISATYCGLVSVNMALLPPVASSALSSLNATLSASIALTHSSVPMMRKLTDSFMDKDIFNLSDLYSAVAGDFLPLYRDVSWATSMCGRRDCCGYVDIRSSIASTLSRKPPTTKAVNKKPSPLRILCSNMHALHCSQENTVDLSTNRRFPLTGSAMHVYCKGPSSSGAASKASHDIAINTSELCSALNRSTPSQPGISLWSPESLFQHSAFTVPESDRDVTSTLSTASNSMGSGIEFAAMCFTSPYSANLLRAETRIAQEAVRHRAYLNHFA